jgi:hypothetical protein
MAGYATPRSLRNALTGRPVSADGSYSRKQLDDEPQPRVVKVKAHEGWGAMRSYPAFLEERRFLFN